MTEVLFPIKKECEEDIEVSCVKEGWEVGLFDEKECKFIKCEHEWEREEDASSVEELYEGHEVKRELVVGPEQLQPQDITHTINALNAAKFNLKQEETPIRFPSYKTLDRYNFKTHGLKICSVSLQRIDYMLTVDQKVSLVKQENKTNINCNGEKEDNYKTCEKFRLNTRVTRGQFYKDVTKASETSFCKREKHDNCQKAIKKKVYKPRKDIKKKFNKPRKCFICDYCGKQFMSRMNFITHIRTHTGEKPYRCEVCKKRFTDISTLIRHRRMHTGEKPHSCVDCDKKFSEKYLLVNHRRIHTGDKPYSCPLCGKQFTGSSNLTRHVRYHASRPFPCDICDRRFNLETHLKSHILSHTKDKPFACDVCEKRFIHSCHLHRHLKIHVGKKSHVCEQCQVAFSQNSTLKRHIQRQVCVKRRDSKM